MPACFISERDRVLLTSVYRSIPKSHGAGSCQVYRNAPTALSVAFRFCTHPVCLKHHIAWRNAPYLDPFWHGSNTCANCVVISHLHQSKPSPHVGLRSWKARMDDQRIATLLFSLCMLSCWRVAAGECDTAHSKNMFMTHNPRVEMQMLITACTWTGTTSKAQSEMQFIDQASGECVGHNSCKNYFTFVFTCRVL